MKINVLLQISTLGKTLVASIVTANKGLFFSVNPEVIKEVASFSELLPTVRVLTFHDSSDSFCISMFIS